MNLGKTAATANEERKRIMSKQIFILNFFAYKGYYNGQQVFLY